MDVRYPIGKFQVDSEITMDLVQGWIEDVDQLPGQLREAVEVLNDEQLDTPYRDGGWTVRQVVHHLADSHMNAYIRFKLALTEENPIIKPYEEAEWAKLPDSELPVEVSLAILENVHLRLVKILNSLGPEDLEKTFVHPDSGLTAVAKNIGLYSWHGRHHLAHITSLCSRKGWKVY
ncbi:putative metal-dependent hydrolase [Robertmurraya yapensis]|uniref:Putative metal-dependent hydrolase EKG37_04130 n=1 Tax=Bacillus yapensis TaxID=2492960 RepID=A0A431WKD6_9BACI|nr:bacillithiol transferase BstA [Bacillus yapensis]RTR35828.1 putative metal-dependent hydrolase [Bacillus yapensis]TKS98630.1 putative metal-dependent hydrolase [Bacillus yapensis]